MKNFSKVRLVGAEPCMWSRALRGWRRRWLIAGGLCYWCRGTLYSLSTVATVTLMELRIFLSKNSDSWFYTIFIWVSIQKSIISFLHLEVLNGVREIPNWRFIIVHTCCYWSYLNFPKNVKRCKLMLMVLVWTRPLHAVRRHFGTEKCWLLIDTWNYSIPLYRTVIVLSLAVF